MKIVNEDLKTGHQGDLRKKKVQKMKSTKLAVKSRKVVFAAF